MVTFHKATASRRANAEYRRLHKIWKLARFGRRMNGRGNARHRLEHVEPARSSRSFSAHCEAFRGEELSGRRMRRICSLRQEARSFALTRLRSKPDCSSKRRLETDPTRERGFFSFNISRLAHSLAEREGFEPSIPLRVCRISSAVLSTAQPPLRRTRDHIDRPPLRQAETG